MKCARKGGDNKGGGPPILARKQAPLPLFFVRGVWFFLKNIKKKRSNRIVLTPILPLLT
jgi:hypothetical protein